MSDLRLCVVDGRNTLRMRGAVRNLDTAPAILGLPPYVMLDYEPDGDVALIQPVGAAKRDLSDRECQHILLWMLRSTALW